MPPSRESPILKPMIWRGTHAGSHPPPPRVAASQHRAAGLAAGRDAVELRLLREVRADDARHVRAVRTGVDADGGACALAQHLDAEVEERDRVQRAWQPVRSTQCAGRSGRGGAVARAYR